MFICICKAVTDKEIKQAINEGACTKREVYRCTGAGNVCGKCQCDIKQLLVDNNQTDTMPQFA